MLVGGGWCSKAQWTRKRKSDIRVNVQVSCVCDEFLREKILRKIDFSSTPLCLHKYANVSSEAEEHEKLSSIFLLSLVVTELERVKKHIFSPQPASTQNRTKNFIKISPAKSEGESFVFNVFNNWKSGIHSSRGGSQTPANIAEYLWKINGLSYRLKREDRLNNIQQMNKVIFHPFPLCL